MHIIVCIKSVIMRAPKGRAVRSSDSCELNPFDRPALEVALHMKEEFQGKVTALSMGPQSCAFALYEAMAMGVDRGVLISDSALSGSDTLATSTAIGAAIKKLSPFDLVLFGTRTADSDTGQVGPETAVFLDLPLVTGARVIQKQATGLRVERSADGFLESYELSLPAALTIHPAAAESRDMGLLGIGEAYGQGEIMTWTLADIDLSPDQVGEKGSPTRLVSLTPAKKGRKCAFLTGSVEDQADELTERLSELGLVT